MTVGPRDLTAPTSNERTMIAAHNLARKQVGQEPLDISGFFSLPILINPSPHGIQLLKAGTYDDGGRMIQSDTLIAHFYATLPASYFAGSNSRLVDANNQMAGGGPLSSLVLSTGRLLMDPNALTEAGETALNAMESEYTLQKLQSYVLGEWEGVVGSLAGLFNNIDPDTQSINWVSAAHGARIAATIFKTDTGLAYTTFSPDGVPITNAVRSVAPDGLEASFEEVKQQLHTSLIMWRATQLQALHLVYQQVAGR